MAHTPLPGRKHRHLLQLGDRGRLVLPSSIRKELGLREGDRLVLTVGEEGVLHLRSLSAQVKKVRGILQHLSPERSLADELVQERREEAVRD